MKSMRRIFLFILTLCLTWIVQAKVVNPEDAKIVGLKLMKLKVAGFSGSVKSISYLDEAKTVYILNFSPQGWMMLSSDDSSEPLLGYSAKGHLPQNQEIPDNMKGWLDVYSKQITSIARKNLPALKQWNPDFHQPASRAIGSPIDNLIVHDWDQDYPYNAYCPKDGSKRTLVGCVAVAMGQAMTVTRHPARPVGYHSSVYGQKIDYDNEEPYDWNKILDGTQDNYKEVARFLYHLGVSVDMQYGVDGSGTYANLIPAALQKNFSYPETVRFYWKDSYRGDWTQLLINELGAGRPIIYCGVDVKENSGHCFNFDGYDGDGMFHVNWGWSGYGNGYFRVENLRDELQGMDFTAQQGAVVGIMPPNDLPQNIVLSNNTVESGKPADLLVGELSVVSSAPSHTFTYDVRGKYNKSTKSYEEIPFKVVGNKLYTTKSLDAGLGIVEVEVIATDVDLNASIAQGFKISVTGNADALTALDEVTSLSYNKNTGILTLKSVEGVSYTITSENGVVVAQGSFSTGSIGIEVADWSGRYLVHLEKDEAVKDFSIVLKSKVMK